MDGGESSDELGAAPGSESEPEAQAEPVSMRGRESDISSPEISSDGKPVWESRFSDDPKPSDSKPAEIERSRTKRPLAERSVVVAPEGYRRRTWIALVLGIAALTWLLPVAFLAGLAPSLPSWVPLPIRVAILFALLLVVPVWALVYSWRVCRVRTEDGRRPPGRGRASAGRFMAWIGLAISTLFAAIVVWLSADFVLNPLEVVIEDGWVCHESISGVVVNEGDGVDDALLTARWISTDGSLLYEESRSFTDLDPGERVPFTIPAPGGFPAGQCEIEIERPGLWDSEAASSTSSKHLRLS